MLGIKHKYFIIFDYSSLGRTYSESALIECTYKNLNNKYLYVQLLKELKEMHPELTGYSEPTIVKITFIKRAS